MSLIKTKNSSITWGMERRYSFLCQKAVLCGMVAMPWETQASWSPLPLPTSEEYNHIFQTLFEFSFHLQPYHTESTQSPLNSPPMRGSLAAGGEHSCRSCCLCLEVVIVCLGGCRVHISTNPHDSRSVRGILSAWQHMEARPG